MVTCTSCGCQFEIPSRTYFLCPKCDKKYIFVKCRCGCEFEPRNGPHASCPECGRRYYFHPGPEEYVPEKDLLPKGKILSASLIPIYAASVFIPLCGFLFFILIDEN